MKFNYKDESLIFTKSSKPRKRKKNRRLERRLKLWLLNPNCTYCKRLLTLEESTLDHVVPRSHSRNEPKLNNLVIACLKCNQKKSSYTKEQFLLVVSSETSEQDEQNNVQRNA